jgi:hypothetical protein
MATLSEQQLEQLWIKYQFDIAGLRGALGPLYNVAFHARQAHTFNVDEQPETRAVRAAMAPTPGEPNGVPDGHAVMAGPTYGARAASVMAASTVLMTFDSAIQELATRLGTGRGDNMQAGDRIANLYRTLSEPASTLISAAANNIRHVDEWHASATAYSNPLSQADINRRERQNRSMMPLANVLGCALPVTDNVAFEVLQLLAELPNDQGSYDRVELHVLRIGQDAVQRAGLTGAPIGVTIQGTFPSELLDGLPPEDVTISDGVARTASSITSDRILNVNPSQPAPSQPSGDAPT